MDRLSGIVDNEYRAIGVKANARIFSVPLRDHLVGSIRPTLLLVSGAARWAYCSQSSASTWRTQCWRARWAGDVTLQSGCPRRLAPAHCYSSRCRESPPLSVGWRGRDRFFGFGVQNAEFVAAAGSGWISADLYGFEGRRIGSSPRALFDSAASIPAFVPTGW
jgi:hypothetical protein